MTSSGAAFIYCPYPLLYRSKNIVIHSFRIPTALSWQLQVWDCTKHRPRTGYLWNLLLLFHLHQRRRFLLPLPTSVVLLASIFPPCHLSDPAQHLVRVSCLVTMAARLLLRTIFPLLPRRYQTAEVIRSMSLSPSRRSLQSYVIASLQAPVTLFPRVSASDMSQSNILMCGKNLDHPEEA